MWLVFVDAVDDPVGPAPRSLRMSRVSWMDSYSATEISMASARPLRLMVK